MFELPSIKGVREFVINADAVAGRTKPMVIYQPAARSA
jgi:ATP-dependent protease Clp ATPase subunit